MAENKLKTALREVVSTEFAEIPRNEREINHSFSDDFLRRMDKLTHAQRSRFWRMTNTVPKRVAAVAAAFLLIALTACSIPSVRAAATKFIRETFDSYVHFFTEKSERRQITEHYRLTELPDGYAEEIVVKNDSCCISFYQNEAGDRIIFAQSVTEDFVIDTPTKSTEKVVAKDTGDIFKFEADVEFTEGTRTFGVRFYEDEDKAESYQFVFNVTEDRYVFEKKPNWPWPANQNIGLERPLELVPGKKYNIKMIVDDTIATIYVDGVALNARAYKRPGESLSLFASEGSLKVTNCKVTTGLKK